MEKVFVSYSRKDSEFVKTLVDFLSQEGLSIWLDTLHIPTGEPWDLVVERAIIDSTHVVVVLSKNSVQSPNVLDEIGLAVDKKKKIIPITIEECEPPLRIRRIQYIDFKLDKAAHFTQLMVALRQPSTDTVDNVTLAPDLALDAKTGVNSEIAKGEAAIVSINDSNPPVIFPMGRAIITIGRADDCDVTLDIKAISRHHAQITRHGDHYFIEDLASHNGTYVNGHLLDHKRILQNGDEISLASSFQFMFVDSDATDPLPLESDAPPTYVPLQLDRESRKVFINNIELEPPLSLMQYRLLELLYLNKGKICTRDQVIECVWPDAVSENVEETVLDALVRGLRDRFTEYDPDRSYIITVRGLGFRLDDPA